MATTKKADETPQEAPVEPQDARPAPEGATVTLEDFEARKAAYEAEQAPKPPDLTVCVNDGAPAAYRTTGAGRVPVAYCEDCANRTYPDGQGMERIDAPSE